MLLIRRHGKTLRMHWWQIFCVIIDTILYKPREKDLTKLSGKRKTLQNFF